MNHTLDELARLAKAAFDNNSLGWWISAGTLEDVQILDNVDRDFIAAANPATFLELLDTNRRMRETLTALLPFVRDLEDCGPPYEGWQSEELMDIILEATALTTGEEKYDPAYWKGTPDV